MMAILLPATVLVLLLFVLGTLSVVLPPDGVPASIPTCPCPPTSDSSSRPASPTASPRCRRPSAGGHAIS